MVAGSSAMPHSSAPPGFLREPVDGPVDSVPAHEDAVIRPGEVIAVVDDDEYLRESLQDLLKELGYRVMAFASGEEFLGSAVLGHTECVILDIAMPGMSGPEVQRELMTRRLEIPVIYITAHGDQHVRSRLIQQGAVDCLFKPFTEAALLGALNTALRKTE
jgi:FixJ family two-component response regulator